MTENIHETMKWLLYKHEGGLVMAPLTVEQVAAFRELFKKIDAVITAYMSGTVNPQGAINEIGSLIDEFYNRKENDGPRSN